MKKLKTDAPLWAAVLYTVRNFQQIHEDALLIMSNEIVLSEENPEQEKFKQWL